MKQLFVLSLLLSVLSAGAQPPIDVQHYRFELALSDVSDAINGKAVVTLRFTAPASSFTLDLASGKDEKGMVVFRVQEGNQTLRFSHQSDLLEVYLQSPAKEGEVRSFEISYMGTPADGLIISRNKFGDRTFFADNWPNRAHLWLPVNDRPDDKASFEFVVTAPARYAVVSNGLKQDEKLLPSGNRQTHWKETTPLSTKIMVIGLAPFAVREFADRSAGVPVSAWAYPQDSAKIFYDYAVAPSIVRFFSDYLAAAFPFAKLANVQSTTIFGGMENAGAIFYDEGLVSGQRKSEDIIAHEIAHQWFGDMASEKSFAHLWLSEGFATFLTNYYFEKRYGRDSATARWRQAREKVIRFTQSSTHSVVDSTPDLMSLLNANSYEKGAWVLYMLRQQLGDTSFQRVLQTYYRQFRGGNAETRDFQAVAEAVSGRKLDDFFRQWLYRPGLPRLSTTTKGDGDKMVLTVRQEGTLYAYPLEVLVVYEDGTRQLLKLDISERETEIKFKGKGIRQLTRDPDAKLLYLQQ